MANQVKKIVKKSDSTSQPEYLVSFIYKIDKIYHSICTLLHEYVQILCMATHVTLHNRRTNSAAEVIRIPFGHPNDSSWSYLLQIRIHDCILPLPFPNWLAPTVDGLAGHA